VIFKFKRFEVANERSAMKVNTDGVLLGAAVGLEGISRVLDVGTGTGVIALMVAQRLESEGLETEKDGMVLETEKGEDGFAREKEENSLGPLNDFEILGIDIDEASAEEASKNFKNSPWASKMRAENVPLAGCTGVFDLIVSNPPYYEESLTNPDARKKVARHTGELSYKTLIEFASSHLSERGRLVMILPADREKDLVRFAVSFGFYPKRILYVRTIARKAPSRIIVELSREMPDQVGHDGEKVGHDGEKVGHDERTVKNEKQTVEHDAQEGKARGWTHDELILQEGGEPTEAYRNLVKDFYLWA